MPPVTEIEIITFVGSTDFNHINAAQDSEDQSPIWRLISHAYKSAPDRLKVSILLDRPERAAKAETDFIEQLTMRLKSDYPQLVAWVDPIPLRARNGAESLLPTDYDGIYRRVKSALTQSQRQETSETGRRKAPREHLLVQCWFHMSSGTPAMHVVMLWIASSLRFGRTPVLWETSRGGVKELKMPVVIAVKERLTSQPIKKLDARPLPVAENIVIIDPQVDHAYHVLYAYREWHDVVAILGPQGSGKRTAVQELIRWRHDCSAEQQAGSRNIMDFSFHDLSSDWPLHVVSMNSGRKTVVVRDVTGQPALLAILNECLQRIKLISSKSLAVKVVLTGDPNISQILDGLPVEVTKIHLPPAALRTDLAEVAWAMINQAGTGVKKKAFLDNIDAALNLEMYFPRGLFTLLDLAQSIAASSAGRSVGRALVGVSMSVAKQDVARTVIKAVSDVFLQPGHLLMKELEYLTLLEAMEHAVLSLNLHSGSLSKTEASERIGTYREQYTSRLEKTESSFRLMVKHLWPHQYPDASRWWES